MTKNEKAVLAKGKVSRTFTFANVTVKLYNPETDAVETVVENIGVTSEKQAMSDIRKHYKNRNIEPLKITINGFTTRFIAMLADTFIELAEINQEIQGGI